MNPASPIDLIAITALRVQTLLGAEGVALRAGLARTLSQAERLKASTFGAKGDGETDDTAAIQAAIYASDLRGLANLPASAYDTRSAIPGATLLDTARLVASTRMRPRLTREIVEAALERLEAQGLARASGRGWQYLGAELAAAEPHEAP